MFYYSKKMLYNTYKTEQLIQYHTTQVYTFKKFIDINKIDWNYFCCNPNAVLYFEKYPEIFKKLNDQRKICWSWLSANPGAIHILEKNIDKIWWDLISTNPSAIPFLEAHIDKIHWGRICENVNGIPLLEKYYDIKNETPYKSYSILSMINDYLKHDFRINPVVRKTIDWNRLSCNPSAIHILEKNMDKINWRMLSSNPNAVHILEKNQDKIDPIGISKNSEAIPFLGAHPYLIDTHTFSKNPNSFPLMEKLIEKGVIHISDFDWDYISDNTEAIPFLKKYPEKIDWIYLSGNPNAIEMLQNQPNKIDWTRLSINPNIFDYDYPFLRKHIQPYKEELIQMAYHPRRIVRMIELLGGEFDWDLMI